MPRAALLAQSSALISRLKSLARISEVDIAFLMNTLGPVERYPNGAELFREGEIISGPRFILEGWALRTRYLSDGRRQIFGFVLPGLRSGCSFLASPVGLLDVVLRGLFRHARTL